MRPLKKLGIIEEELIINIFSNLDSIVLLHQDISATFAEIQKNSEGITKLEKMIEAYKMNTEDFFLYKIYCSNQNNASRALKRLYENEEFVEFVSVKYIIINQIEL